MGDRATLEMPSTLAEVPIVEFGTAVAALPLSPEERQIAAAVVDLIAEQPQDTFLARVEAAIKIDEEAPPSDAGPLQAVRRQALRAWWYFGQGLDAGGARRMDDATRCYRLAAYGFAQLGNSAQLDETIAAGVLSEAMLRIQAQDFAAGERLLGEARQLLEGGSGMGAQQREMIAGLEVESLFQQSTQAMRQGNQNLAEQLLRKAAERVEGLANGHDGSDPLHGLYAGQAGLLRAQAAFLAGSRAISLYNFDDVNEGESTAAAKAAELLAEGSPANAALADFYAQVLGVLEQLATIMLRVLGSSFHQEKGQFHSLHERVKLARKAIPAAAGANASFLAEGCDLLNQWLNNLERLAKPSKRDLGIFGGLVTCVTFCVLLVVVAVVNRAFQLGASATAIFAACTPLAIAAGFGLAGLKVWRSSSSSDGATE